MTLKLLILLGLTVLAANAAPVGHVNGIHLLNQYSVGRQVSLITKLLYVNGISDFKTAAPRNWNTLDEFLFRREKYGGCSPAELKILEESGVDIEASPLDCSKFSHNEQKRGCSFIYTDTSACCSSACNWLMEFHCMNPSQMICKK